MTDIFLSYAREDLSRIKPIVVSLQAVGWSVWWDRSILPGKTFGEVLAEALESARCIVVAWSSKSIRSARVKAEAESGMQRRILVPCLLDQVKPPLQFQDLWSADLVNWTGVARDDKMRKLIQAIAEFCPPSSQGSLDRQEHEAPERVIRVDPNTTIMAALQLAGQDDRLLIQEGIYRESIIFEKPLELIGLGDREKIIIESNDENVILSGAAHGRITNLTIRYSGDHASGVKIVKGALILEDCDITSRGLSCVSVQFSAQPIIRRNRIHDGRQEGVYAGEGAGGVIEDNRICLNVLAGVAIWRNASPLVRGNEIWGCREGVYVGDRGRGVIDGNKIHDNRGPAIQTAGGEPKVGHNEQYRNSLEFA